MKHLVNFLVYIKYLESLLLDLYLVGFLKNEMKFLTIMGTQFYDLDIVVDCLFILLLLLLLLLCSVVSNFYRFFLIKVGYCFLLLLYF